MKRLIICCDGTWNSPEQEDNGVPSPTNVFKLYNAIADKDNDLNISQLKYYHPGLGSEGGFLQSLGGGAFGVGISRHICSAYHWLASHYEEGDQIYLYGFSRGAFTVRSLSGFLGCGLLNLNNVDVNESWEQVHKAYKQAYRKKKPLQHLDHQDWNYFHHGEATPIRFIGVWDTVGALGIPDDLELLNIFDNKKKWQFHNTDLGNHIETARHAMAIDEIRSSFCVTRWKNAESHPDAVEKWFPGVHADVGGGYANCDLSHGALIWMITESAATELKFRNGTALSFSMDPLGVMHNSYRGIFAKLRSRPRNIPSMGIENKQLFHPGALKRQQASPISYRPYHPTTTLKPGESFTIDIFADTRWNETSLYLHQGDQYTFTAQGKWRDSKDSCDWKGTQDGKLTAGDILRGTSSFLGEFENLYKALTSNESSDFIGTKRIEELNWFTLVGAIANDSGSKKVVKNDGSPAPHQYVELAAHETVPLKIDAAGYLYCFPNDVWTLYGNNHGSISLIIKRVK